MAATVTVRAVNAEGMQQDKSGGKVFIEAVVTMDDSYPTGGEAVAVATVEAAAKTAGFVVDLSALTGGVASCDSTGTYLGYWDQANGKLMAFSALGTQVTAETDLEDVVFPVIFTATAGY